jgi:hypothetical protein
VPDAPELGHDVDDAFRRLLLSALDQRHSADQPIEARKFRAAAGADGPRHDGDARRLCLPPDGLQFDLGHGG